MKITRLQLRKIIMETADIEDAQREYPVFERVKSDLMNILDSLNIEYEEFDSNNEDHIKGWQRATAGGFLGGIRSMTAEEIIPVLVLTNSKALPETGLSAILRQVSRRHIKDLTDYRSPPYVKSRKPHNALDNLYSTFISSDKTLISLDI